MKLTPALLLVAAGPLLAQTTTPAKPAVHHTTSTAAHPVARTACGADVPVLPAAIPKLPASAPVGCPKPLYAFKYTDYVVGTGAAVAPRKWLTVAYTGYLIDGTKFDSSIGVDKDGKPKEPITFPYGAHQVITGWDTGFEGMMVGGKRRMYIPFQLAYGEAGRPPVIPAKAMLIFDVELVAISDNPPKPPTPPTPPKPATPPPAALPPTSTTQPAPASPPPGSPTTPPRTVDPSKPATVPPPTDPTKPTATPPRQ